MVPKTIWDHCCVMCIAYCLAPATTCKCRDYIIQKYRHTGQSRSKYLFGTPAANCKWRSCRLCFDCILKKYCQLGSPGLKTNLAHLTPLQGMVISSLFWLYYLKIPPAGQRRIKYLFGTCRQLQVMDMSSLLWLVTEIKCRLCFKKKNANR